MKRFFFTAIAIAAVAVSCTKSGLLESPQTYETPITFEPYTGKAPITKATEAINETIQTEGFSVLGFTEAANSTTITTTEDPWLDKDVAMVDGAWTYTGAMYWQDNAELTFFAYGNNAGSYFAPTSGSTSKIEYTYAVDGNIYNQKDLVISPMMQNCKNGDANGSFDGTSTSSSVNIQLYHVLSRVGFKLKTEGTTGVDVLIKNVTLKGKGKSSVDFNLSTAVRLEEGSSTTVVKYANDAIDEVESPVTGDSNLSYSIFNSDYAKGKDTNPTAPYEGFITTSTTSSTTTPIAIWKNCVFESGAIDVNDKDDNSANDDVVISELLNKETGAIAEPTADASETIKNEYNTLLAAKNGRYLMIAPQTMQNAVVEVVYQLDDATEQLATLSLNTFAFNAGKAYEFVFTVSTTSVGFSVTVDPWTDGADEDFDLN